MILELTIIAAVALIASFLSFFSGFGLGTLLLPAFALFVPLELAIALTAIVHLLNNAFKLILIGKHTHVKTLILFGIPSLIFALLGSWTLVHLVELPTLATYTLNDQTFDIKLVNVVIASLIIAFALLELLPSFSQKHFPLTSLPLGGIFSGFFGGLSGHQGAIRSLFLIRLNFTKERYIATCAAISCLVDVARLLIYSYGFHFALISANFSTLATACLFAFLGALIGNLLIHKITITSIQILVSLMLMTLATLIGLGIL